MKTAKNFFSEKEKQKIISCIQNAESQTTAEICVHIDNFCFGNPLKKAMKIFLKNNMHRTQYRNAVLFYISAISKKLAIVADKGIYEKVPENVWNEMVEQLITSFKNNTDKAETLCKCIEKTGAFLKQYFPAINNQNPNELSDEISFS